MSDKLIAALKRRGYKTPQQVLRKLGLDAALLKPAPEKRLARDAKFPIRRLGKDGELLEVNDNDLRDFVRDLSPEQMAELFKLLQEEMEGMPAELAEEVTEDEDEDDERQDNTEELTDDYSLPPYLRRPGMKTAQDRRPACGTGQTWREKAAADKRVAARRLAQDRAPARKTPSFHDTFPATARIKWAG